MPRWKGAPGFLVTGVIEVKSPHRLERDTPSGRVR
ncbi:hypothetical protein BJ981_007530 [Sphaerisporangium krabiense]|uniref:Uncharacterized protein n=1 Tax=Sphaerisporangium krabiense TaxID=763782 RepID=A0A7W8ZD02_9ACTN|nr:hypothetical protein [Sphaerisporangium krabiense]